MHKRDYLFPTKMTMQPLRSGSSWVCRLFDFMGGVVHVGRGKTRKEACEDAKKFRKKYVQKLRDGATEFRRCNRINGKQWTRGGLFFKPRRRLQQLTADLTSLFWGALQPAYG